MKKTISFTYGIKFIMCLLLFFSFGKLVRPINIYADYPDMDMNATPNPVGSGARAMGMGGAFISVADDATAASWNPGGLLQLLKPEISIVGSWFSGKIDYKTAEIVEADIEDISPDVKHLNYLSIVRPFILFRRNMVFSLNYQHLYEFSKDNIYTWEIKDPDVKTDISKRSHKRQRGSLNTISPALALQINPSFFIGLTLNFWPKHIIDNGWENLNIVDGEGEVYGREIATYTEIYERYQFSGFNMHLGLLYRFLWKKNRPLRLGFVIKTPFKANIRHEQRLISYENYPQNPVLNSYSESFACKDLTLEMPISYGLGMSIVFSDSFSMALDIYRTHWDQYLIKYPSGKEYSPINKKPKKEANIKPTTQIRLGGEYRIQDPKKIIPIRAGIFYDPEPAAVRPDDFYGVSLGTGITYNERFSLDFVYQFRFGEKKDVESIMGKDVCGRVTQHYFYTSVIFYL